MQPELAWKITWRIDSDCTDSTICWQYYYLQSHLLTVPSVDIAISNRAYVACPNADLSFVDVCDRPDDGYKTVAETCCWIVKLCF